MTTAVAPYEIASGGALRHVERAVHVTRGSERDWIRRVVVILAVVYVPLIAFGIVSRVTTGEWIPALTQVSVHARGLVAIPLLLAAEHLADTRARAFGTYMFESGLVQPVEDAYRAAVARTIRLRDSAVAETIILIVAIATLFFKQTYLATGALAAWGALPELIVFRFLLMRWVWRWSLWTMFLWRVSRLPLVLQATHPDRLAGLFPALGPAYAFTAVVAAGSSAIAGGWAEKMLQANAALKSFYQPALAYVVIAVALALAPACVFIGTLSRVRRIGLGRYGAFANRYVDAFDTKWRATRGEDALGSSDIQSLADLGNSYGVVGEMRLVPWSLRLIKLLIIAALAPIAALALLERDVIDLVAQLGSAML